MMPFGLEITLFPTPPSPGAQRDPEPTAEGATEGLCSFPCSGRQNSGTAAAAAAAPLQPPRASPLSRANPEPRGHRGAVPPSRKKIIPAAWVSILRTSPGREPRLGITQGALVPSQKEPSLPFPSSPAPPEPRCSFWGVCVRVPGHSRAHVGSSITPKALSRPAGPARERSAPPGAREPQRRRPHSLTPAGPCKTSGKKNNPSKNLPF